MEEDLGEIKLNELEGRGARGERGGGRRVVGGFRQKLEVAGPSLRVGGNRSSEQ